MWSDRRSVPMATTPIIRMPVRPTDITGRAGLRMESLSARARGITDGDMAIGDARIMDADFMTDDQRFAARRPDVLVYETSVLDADTTIAGPIEAKLWVATTGTDADFVVKIVDVWPEDVTDPTPNPTGVKMSGYQQLVRAEIMRGKFRNSLERPEPFKPGEPALVTIALPDDG
ncbi:MAG: X-Pro dipeptidyl-peptidase, partial [Acidobacteriia bacterium]|nr:X-Pro dipeptidyl-peptidase [Terriglobia bacterium]